MKSTIKTIAAFLALTIALLTSEPSIADERVNGANLKTVTYKLRGTPQGKGEGVFKMTEGKNWVEKSPDGEFTFTEKMRDEWSVYLYDEKRNMAVQIDLYEKEILIGIADPNGAVTVKEMLLKYTITSWSKSLSK